MSHEYKPVVRPPLDPARRRREGESLDAYLERLWPDIWQAVADVDRTLFQTTLSLSPADRLEQATQAAWELDALRASISRDR